MVSGSRPRVDVGHYDQRCRLAASGNYLASPSGAPRENCTGATRCSVIGVRIPTALGGNPVIIMTQEFAWYEHVVVLFVVAFGVIAFGIYYGH